MKLGFGAILSIGIAIAIISVAIGLFGVFGNGGFLPNMEQARLLNANSDELETVANQMPAAQRRVRQAEELLEQKASEWRVTVARHTPPASVEQGGINLAVNAWQLTVDARRFRNNVQRAVNRQLLSGGVTVVNGPMIPFPDESASSILASYFNFPSLTFPVVIFDLGAVTVRGTYSQITNHIRSWSNMPGYLAVADGLSLESFEPTASPPVLTGTYNLTIVGFIRGREIFPPVPEIGAGGGAGAGVPGAPPGGFGAPGFGGPGGAMRGGPPAGLPPGSTPPMGRGGQFED
ncbi:MAG: hypothetical protein SNJ74_08705 [Fimbriimonadaceae bacterium]